MNGTLPVVTFSPPAQPKIRSVSLPPMLQMVTARGVVAPEASGVDAEEVLKLAQGLARLIVLEWDVAADELRWSASPEWLLGPLPASGRYPVFREMVHVDDRARFLEARMGDHAMDYRIVRTDGVVLWLAARASVYRDAAGEIVRLVAVLQDVTERKRAEQELIQQRHRLQMVHTVAGLHAVEWDVGSDRLLWDGDPESILGPRPASGHYPSYTAMIHPEDRERFLGWRGGAGRDSREFRIVRTDGEVRCLSVRERVIVGTYEHPERVLIALQDVSERERLASLAQYDAVTGLPNRNLYNDRLSQALTRSARDGRQIGVMFLDLDRFKAVNDTLGHHLGDVLLEQVAGRLQSCLRKTDTVARLGGDEFTVVVEGFRERAQLSRVAEKILGVLSTPFSLQGHEVSISASIGIATCPADGTTCEALLRRADTAMYRAKGRGSTFLHATDEGGELPRVESTVTPP